MAAALRSSAVLALRRAAAPASPRLSSAGRNGAGNARGRMYHDYSGGRGTGDNKGDGFFCFAAAIGTFMFACVIDGDFWWGTETTSRQPRMSRRRR